LRTALTELILAGKTSQEIEQTVRRELALLQQTRSCNTEKGGAQ
jgi:hypothetical protein